MHAKLPEVLRETHQLGQLRPGQCVFTVPWAMSVDGCGYCWLDSKHIYTRQGGTAQMIVVRDRETDAYSVVVPRGTTYTASKRDDSSRFAIPVATVHLAGE